MPRFDEGQAQKPDALAQRFSFTGKLRGADVLRRLVEVCGYDLLRQTLGEWETAGQPPGWTPKAADDCGGCDEEKEAEEIAPPPVAPKRRRKPKKASAAGE